MTQRGSLNRTVLLILAAGALMAATWTAVRPEAASATHCKYGGSTSGGCMPSGYYGFDRYWNCGLIYSWESCYQQGTKNLSSAETHTWGWGSADYDGAGAVYLKVETADFYGLGHNLVRACFSDACTDQGSKWSAMWVKNAETNGSRHTIYGHGKA